MRETEECEYKKAIDRKKAQEKYGEELRALDKKTRERQEALEKSWQARGTCGTDNFDLAPRDATH